MVVFDEFPRRKAGRRSLRFVLARTSPGRFLALRCHSLHILRPIYRS